MQHLEVSGAVRPIYGVVRRQREYLLFFFLIHVFSAVQESHKKGHMVACDHRDKQKYYDTYSDTRMDVLQFFILCS